MTVTDRNNIKLLYHFHRYNKATIAKLYGLSASRIKVIIAESSNTTTVPLDDCLLCGLDGAKQYFVDGDEENNYPQNKVMLCEADKRRIEHLQFRRREGIIKSQY